MLFFLTGKLESIESSHMWMTTYFTLHTDFESCFPLFWYLLTPAWKNLRLVCLGFFRQMQCSTVYSTVELLQHETSTVRYNKNLITFFFYTLIHKIFIITQVPIHFTS